ncbi:TadE/TadG family type IV pilus assembly protein [Pectobacterium odoriferum]|uniref:Pilus assembly protein TadE n=1 Tax=Pectobacterium odoriferum TaxID=78398 RepID=A0ABD6VU04_9GAMM|nr:TadE family protein [Pectobacterium odoriferum]GKW04288.1 pilus biosynthesis protein TadE [Pectobacterium carotovorum subsp. carotovorum]AIU86951.1 pilus assembly protein TadE [Pectobacterium odoriferum]KGA32972.1 pilus assembly protein TadE [Pectobacterium odoriferum]KGA41354.1 pilus assembly protein TadE [Pectobacterium odoriferum]MBA0188848.1 pilus assembly protein [Pectobacterium odoriferum]
MLAKWKSKVLRLSLIKDCRGIATIEFALTVMVFIIMVLFMIECARLAYVSSVIDLAVSEAAKDAKNAPENLDGGYRSRFEKRLMDRGGSLWGFLTHKDAVSINLGYAKSIDDMVRTGGGSSTRNQPLARYQLSYRYQPMFFPFPHFWADSLMNREVIFVQEFERSKFSW